MKHVLVLSLVLFFVQIAPAQALGKSRFKAVAPFLEEQTIAVIRIDVRRVDVQRLPALVKLIPERSVIEGFVKQFKDAGAGDVFVVFTLHDVPLQAPFIVAPGNAGIADALRAFKMEEVAKIGSAYVAGSKTTLQRLRDLKAADLPDMKKAFDALPDSAVQVVAVLPDLLRRSLDESVPKLPAPFADISIKSFTRGLHWVSLSIDSVPQEMLGFTVQAGSADEAKVIDKTFANALRALLRKDGNAPPEVALLEKLRPKLDGDRLTLKMSEKEIDELLTPIVRKMLEASQHSQRINNLKQIALAMHSYHDVYKSFPATASYDKQDRPLLSWRVHLLPFVGENELYNQFRLDEPWDSEHNRKLIERMPAVYAGNPANPQDKRTSYLAPVGKETVFPPGTKGINLFKDIPDGTSNTILIVEADADHAVVWTRPQDLVVDLQKPFIGLVDKSRDYFLAALADGSVRVISNQTAPTTLRALFTRNGGETVPGS